MTTFPEQLRHGELSEVLPDVFFVSGESRPNFNGMTWCFSRNMTVVRDGDELTLVNTLRLDDAGLAALDALGTVRHVVKLGSFHGRDDAFYLDRYDASMWALPAMEHERGVKTTAELVAGQPGPCAGSSVFVYDTADTPEALLVLERHGGIVLSCDSLQNWEGPDDFFDEPSAEKMGAFGFFREANVGPGWRQSANPEASDFRRVLALPFEHLLSAHGKPLLESAHAAVSATVGELFPS